MGSFPSDHLIFISLIAASQGIFIIWDFGFLRNFASSSSSSSAAAAAKMICLMVSQSHLSMASIFFYTCFWIPFLQLKRALARMVGVVFCLPEEGEMGCNQLCLPVARFQDLQAHGSKRCGQVVEETCSICLVEFESEDLVSQLAKCGHVFHMACIEGWIELSHFTCPICRSLLFGANTSHAKWDGDVHS